MSTVIQATYDEIISKIRQAGVPNNVTVWEESGSILLGFGEFVAEITPEEIEHWSDSSND
jgi:hypothetical protein